MSVFSSIKNWLRKTFGGGGSSSNSSRARTVSNYGGGGSRSYRSYEQGGYTKKAPIETREQRMKRETEERKKKQEQITKNLSAITDVKSAGKTASQIIDATKGMERVSQKIGERAKATPPDPKVRAAKQARERADERLKRVDNAAKNVEKKLNEFQEKIEAKAEADRKSFNKATNDRYNVEKYGQQARIAQKMQMFDPEAEKWEIERHPIAASAARGALSGVTFGTSELLARNSKARQESGLEEFYQTHKSKGAELAGDIVGSFAGFGLTGGASAKAVGKLAPNAIARAGERGAERIASNATIRRLAEREALKRFGTDGITKEAVDQIARRMADTFMAELGKDAAINATTGLVSDVTHASREHEVGSPEWWKLMGESAAINATLGLATSAVPAFRVRRRAGAELLEGAARNADEMAEAVSRNADEAVRPPNAEPPIMAEEPPVRLEEEDVPDFIEEYRRYEALRNRRNVRPSRRAVKEDVRLPHRSVEETAAEDVEQALKDSGVTDSQVDNALKDLDSEEVKPLSRKSNEDVPGNNKDISEREKPEPPDNKVGALKKERESVKSKLAELRQKVKNEADADEANKLLEEIDSLKKQDKSLYQKIRRAEQKASKAEPPTIVADESAVNAETKKLAEKANLDLNDDRTVKLLIQRDDLQKELKGLDTESKEWWSKSKEIDQIEQELGIRDKNGLLKPEFKEETVFKKSNRNPKTENVDDFASVDSNEARGMGISADSNKAKPPVAKKKNAKPNLVEQSIGNKMVQRVDKKLGKSTGKGIVPPKLSDVRKVEVKYNKEQASKQKEVLSRSAVTLFRNTTSEEQAKQVAKSIRAGKYNYTRITNLGMMTDVAKQFHAEPDRYTKELISYVDGTKDLLAKDEVSVEYMSWYVVNHTGPMLKEHPELAPLHDACTELVSDISSRGGQVLQLNGAMMRSSPLARRRATLKSIANMLDKSVGVRKKGVTIDGVKVPLSGDKDARIKQIIGLIEKDSNMQAALEQLEKATTEAEMDKATAEIMQASMRLRTRTGMDLFQQWRISGMLGNAKTLIRNRVGNAMFGNIRQVSNQVASLVENSMAKRSKDAFIKEALADRTRGGIDLAIRRQSRIKGSELTDEAAKEAYNAWTEIESNITSGGKYELKLPSGHTDNFAVKALDWWSNLVGGRLEKDDAKALERNFREAYMKGAEKLKKNGRDLADPEIRELLVQRSVQEAQIATFREYNAAADVLTKWTNNLYDADAGLGKKALGFAVESAIPFRKTPLNILKQSLNYSPVGVFNGFRNIRKAAADGNAELLHSAIDNFASGLTGSGIMIGGFMLGYMSDAFTTNAGSKDFDSKFMKQQGVQNYSFTYTDPITGEAHSYTLDWLVPASTTFFAGVELANQIKEADGFSLFDFSKNIGEVASRVIEPVFETSMLSGLYNILNDLQGNGGANSDNTLGAPAIIARELGQNYLNSLVPTLVGQISRTAYSSDKQLNGQTDMEYWVNSMKNKMGLANTDLVTDRLGADTTAYGDVKNKKESPKDYTVSALKNLVLPMNIQKVDMNELDKEKVAEYRRRVKNGENPEDLAYLFPKKQYNKNFSVGDEKVTMNNVELSAYNQAKTTGGEEGMRYVLENVMFNRPVVGPDGKKVLGDNAYTQAQKDKLMKQFKGKSLREVEQWLYDQPEFKNATEAERKKAINGLWSLSSQGKAHGAKRVGEQAVYESRGKDVNEYNFNNEISDKKKDALQPYIDAGVLTYEEAVDFARHAGKTYYYENEDGGQSQTYFNKTQMVEYLEKKGYSREKAEALYNSFRNSNAKPYGTSSSSRRYGRGYRRRGYRRGGGGHSKKAKVPVPKKISASSFVKGQALVAKTSSSSSSSKSSAPPLERVQAKIDLPTPKR